MVHKVVFSAGFGAIGAAALAPWHAAPLLMVSMSGLLWLLNDTVVPKRAFVLGWLYGLGHFVVGLHWVKESFQIDAERYGGYAIPAVVALAALLALFPAAACWGTVCSRTTGRGRWSVFASCWAASEWVRGNVFPAFPWNLVASVWVAYDAPLQAVSMIGPYGLGFVSVMIATAPAVALTDRASPRNTARAPLVAALASLAALFIFGNARLAGATDERIDSVRLRLVQPNIPQAMKWDPAYRATIVDRLRALSTMPAAFPPTAIAWPESALPFAINEAPLGLLSDIADIVPAGGSLITGADRRVTAAHVEKRYANSIVVLDDSGAIAAVYDKVRLVPFGEYVPLRNLLPFKGIAAGTSDFVPGSGPALLVAPGVPSFVPLVCYEAIFPGRGSELKGAKWLLNVTNDAWFGLSAGPYQHLALARMRAVESGLPLVRVANTGISAVIDAYGRVLDALPLNVTGILDVQLPRALSEQPWYAAWGDVPLAVLIALGCLPALLQARQGGAALGRRGINND